MIDLHATIVAMKEAGLGDSDIVCALSSLRFGPADNRQIPADIPEKSVEIPADKDRIEKVRAYDRERKRRARDVDGQKMSSGHSTDIPADNADKGFPDKERSPTPPKENNPSQPLVDSQCARESVEEIATQAPPEPTDARQAVLDWNALAHEHGLAKVQAMTGQRPQKLKARLAECGGLDGWRHALSRIAATPGLLGKNDRGWKANFDWLLQPSSFTKLMEGTYDHWKRRSQSNLMDALDEIGENLKNGSGDRGDSARDGPGAWLDDHVDPGF